MQTCKCAKVEVSYDVTKAEVVAKTERSSTTAKNNFCLEFSAVNAAEHGEQKKKTYFWAWRRKIAMGCCKSKSKESVECSCSDPEPSCGVQNACTTSTNTRNDLTPAMSDSGIDSLMSMNKT